MFNFFFKKISYQKPFQLTQIKIFKNTYKLQNNFIGLLLIILLLLINFADIFNFYNIVKIMIYLSIFNISNSLEYLIYIVKENSFFFNFSNTVYFVPITNTRYLFIEKVSEILENNNYTEFYRIIVNINNYFFDYKYISYLEEIRLVFFIFILITILGFLYFNIFKYIYINFFLFIILFFFIINFNYLFTDGLDIWNINIFKINESFKNRNLYIDSNYFLTSNVLLGLEKFSDVSVPWLVDYDDLGWGSDFNIQNQLEQMVERDRKYIIDEISIETSPHLENNKIIPGSLSNRLIKLKQRLAVYFNIFNFYFNSFVETKHIWNKEYKYSIVTKNSKYNKYLYNVFRKNDFQRINPFSTLYDYQHYNKKIFLNIKNNRQNFRHYIEKIKITNDFVLPKKNNITNENFENIGKLKDRKQLVYRKLLNNLDNVENKYNNYSRKPDLIKSTNYIFERQLQEFRSVEYSIKEFLKKKIEKRNFFYFFNDHIILKKKLKIFKKHKKNLEKKLMFILKNYKNTNTFKIKKNKLIANLNYNINDSKFDNLLKYFKSRKIEHIFIDNRDLEYIYFKNNNKKIIGFFKEINNFENIFTNLLLNNQLGLGMYTYSEDFNKLSVSLDGSNFMETIINEFTKHNIRVIWNKKNNYKFYNNLKYFIEVNFPNTENIKKKQIMLTLSIYALNLWSDFENREISVSISDLIRLSMFELIINSYREPELANQKILTKYFWLVNNVILKYYLTQPNYFEYNKKISNWDLKNNKKIKTKVDGSIYFEYLIVKKNINIFKRIETDLYFLKWKLNKYSVLKFFKKENINKKYTHTWKVKKMYNLNYVLPLHDQKEVFLGKKHTWLKNYIRSRTHEKPPVKDYLFFFFRNTYYNFTEILDYIRWAFWPMAKKNYYNVLIETKLPIVLFKKLIILKNILFIFIKNNIDFVYNSTYITISSLNNYFNNKIKLLYFYIELKILYLLTFRFHNLIDITASLVNIKNIILFFINYYSINLLLYKDIFYIKINLNFFINTNYKKLLHLYLYFQNLDRLFNFIYINLINYFINFYYEYLIIYSRTLSIKNFKKISIYVSSKFYLIYYTGEKRYYSLTVDIWDLFKKILEKSKILVSLFIWITLQLYNLTCRIYNFWFIDTSYFIERSIYLFKNKRERVEFYLFLFFNFKKVRKFMISELFNKYYFKICTNWCYYIIILYKLLQYFTYYIFYINMVIFKNILNFEFYISFKIRDYYRFLRSNYFKIFFYLFLTNNFLYYLYYIHANIIYYIYINYIYNNIRMYVYLDLNYLFNYYLLSNTIISYLCNFNNINYLGLSTIFISYYYNMYTALDESSTVQNLKYISKNAINFKKSIRDYYANSVNYTITERYIKAVRILWKPKKIIFNKYINQKLILYYVSIYPIFNINTSNIDNYYYRFKYMEFRVNFNSNDFFSYIGKNLIKNKEIPNYFYKNNFNIFFKKYKINYFPYKIKKYYYFKFKLENYYTVSNLILESVSKKAWYIEKIRIPAIVYPSQQFWRVKSKEFYNYPNNFWVKKLKIKKCNLMGIESLPIFYYIFKNNILSKESAIIPIVEYDKKILILINTVKIRQKWFTSIFGNYNFLKRYYLLKNFSSHLFESYLSNIINIDNLKKLNLDWKNYIEWFFILISKNNLMNLSKTNDSGFIYDKDFSILNIDGGRKYFININYMNKYSSYYNFFFRNDDKTVNLKKYIKYKNGLFNSFSEFLTTSEGTFNKKKFKPDEDIFNKKIKTENEIYTTNLVKKQKQRKNNINLNLYNNKKFFKVKIVNSLINKDIKLFSNYKNYYFFNYLKSYYNYSIFFNFYNKKYNILKYSKIFKKNIYIFSGGSKNIFNDYRVDLSIYLYLFNFYNYILKYFNFLIKIQNFNLMEVFFFDIWEIIEYRYQHESRLQLKLSYWETNNINKKYKQIYLNKLTISDFGIFLYNFKIFRFLLFNLSWLSSINMFYIYLNSITDYNSNIFNFILLERQGLLYRIFIGWWSVFSIFRYVTFFDLVVFINKLISLLEDFKSLDCYLMLYIYKLKIFFNLKIIPLVIYSYTIIRYNIIHIYYYEYLSLNYSNGWYFREESVREDFFKLYIVILSKYNILIHFFYWLSGDWETDPRLPISKEFYKIEDPYYYRLSDFWLDINYFIKNYFKITLINYNFFWIVLIRLEKFINLFNFLPNYHFDTFYSELNNIHNIDNISYYYRIYNLYLEISDIVFQNLVLSSYSYFELFGKLLWLYICIYFDFLFERLVEFDSMTDINPISDSLLQIVELVRSLFSGKVLENLPIYFFNFFDKEIYEDLDDDDYSKTSNNSDSFGDDTSHGLSDINDMDSFEFLGWGFNVSIGTDPGNEFSTINDIVDFPKEIEKFLLTDISDFYNNLFDLDNPKMGEILPSFDITIPINSLWLLNIVYYNPKYGGIIFLNLSALIDFLKILYLDRRISFFSKIYEIVDFFYFDYFKDSWFIFIKIKINYAFIDLFQILDSVYINPLDFLNLLFIYLNFLFNYFGLWVYISLYLVLILITRFSNYFEKSSRVYYYNSFLFFNLFGNIYNYSLFRFIYHIFSNIYIFIKMSFSLLILLTIVYIFSEGFHIFSILRVYSTDQESLLYQNGLFFNLERDPFVEKHIPVDEMWDQFKYESNIDDEWSRIHYNREHSEIMGGSLEQSSIIDSLGFSKKFNFLHYLNELDSEFNSSIPTITRDIPQQIHNKIIDENSYIPKFIKDSPLEREFFRESEMYGPEIEGSLDWENRSNLVISGLEDSWRFNKWFINKHIVESDNFSFWNWGFSSDNEDYYNELYDALLINIADPKWLWYSSNILHERDGIPLIFRTNKSQLYDETLINKNLNHNTKISADNRLINLFNRNIGITDQSPIQDSWDGDPRTDLGISNYNLYGSSIGTLSNSKSIFDSATSDIITQYGEHSTNPTINMPMYFNYVEKDDIGDIKYYKEEDFIFENFFDSIFNTKPDEMSTKNFSEITEKFYNKFRRKRISNFYNFDNFHSKMSKNWILENNFKVKKFVTDGIPEGYFNMSSYVLKDLTSNFKISKLTNNSQNLSLENIRRKDLKYKKLEGSDPNIIYYDEIISDDINKLKYFNFTNLHNNYDSSISYYKNNEYLLKFELSEPNEYWTPRKYPRTRWKWFRKWGFDSPYQKYVYHDLNKRTDPLVFASEQKYDTSVIENLMGENKTEFSIRKKKNIIKKKKNFLTESLILNLKKNIRKTNNVKKYIILNKNKETGTDFKSEYNYRIDNNLISWTSQGPFKKILNNNNINTLRLSKSLQSNKKANIIKKAIYSNYSKFLFNYSKKKSNFDVIKLGIEYKNTLGKWGYNSNTLNLFENFLTSTSNIRGNRLEFADNITKLKIKKKNKIKNFYKYNILENKKIKNYFDFKVKKYKFKVITEYKKVFLENEKKKIIINNKKLKNIRIDNDRLFRKLKIYNYKNKINYKNLEISKKNKSKLKNKKTLLNSYSTIDKVYYGELYNNLFTKKVQEYVNIGDTPKLNILDNFKNKNEYSMDFKKFIFLNNKWSLSNNGKLSYKVYDPLNIKNISEKVSEIKKDNLINKKNKKKIKKAMWSSNKKRKFYDVRGYMHIGNHWPLSYRMHSLILPKYSEDPIFINDEEANRDYSESRNKNFSRRLNNLNVWGDGFVRDIEYFTEFNLNPYELGRVYSDPVWFDDDDVDSIEESDGLRVDALDKEDWDIENSEYRGVSISNLDIEDQIHDLGYWNKFNLGNEDNYYNILNTDVGIKLTEILNSDYLNNKINWYKPSWFLYQNRIKKPWGMDFNLNMNWYGSQHWSIQKNIDSLNSLFSDGSYRIFDTNEILLDKLYKKKIKNNKNNSNIFFDFSKKDLLYNNFKNSYINTEYSDCNLDEYGNDDNLIIYSNEKKNRLFNSDYDFNFLKLNKINTKNKNYNINKNKNKNYYNIEIKPEHYFSTIDRNFESEQKHEWRTKYFQYGKMFRSLEQNAIIRDYYKKFIPLYNRAATPKQISDYFWYYYKSNKKNKFKKFYNNYNTYDRFSSVETKQQNLNWDKKITNPNYSYSSILYDFDMLNQKSKLSKFPNLGYNWISSEIRRKMLQKNKKFSLAMFETYDDSELSFENINYFNNLKNKNKKIKTDISVEFKEKYKPISFGNSPIFLNTNWNKLFNMMLRGNTIIKKRPFYWSKKPLFNKYKTIKSGRENYILDNIFGNYIKNKKYKNPMYDETNAAHRFTAIEDSLKKGAKSSVFDNKYNKFRNIFSENLNLIAAIKDIYEVPFDQNYSSIDDTKTEDFGIFNNIYINTNNNNSNFESNINMVENNNLFSDYKNKIKHEISIFQNKNKISISDLNYSENFYDLESIYDDDNFEDYFNNLNNISNYTTNNVESNYTYSILNNQNLLNESIDEDDEYFNDNILDSNFSRIFPINNNTNWSEYNTTNSENLEFLQLNDYWNDRNVKNQENNIYQKKNYENINNLINTQIPINSNDLDIFKYKNINESSDFYDQISIKDEYTNKKINTKDLFYSTYQLDGRLSPVNRIKNINIGDAKDHNSFLYSENFRRNNLDDMLQVEENKDIFYNYLYYYKNNNSLKNKKTSTIGVNNTKNYLMSRLGKKSKNLNYLTNDFVFGYNNYDISNGNTENNLIENLDDYLNFNNNAYYKKTNIDTFENKIINVKKINLESFNFFKKNNVTFQNNLNFLNNYTYGNYADIIKNNWKKKNTFKTNTGVFSNSFDSNLYNNVINKNKKKDGILNTKNIFDSITYIDKDYKVDPPWGSQRYKKNISNYNYSMDFKNIEFKDDNKTKFNYGLDNTAKDFIIPNIVKNELNHYFKYIDNRSHISKNIDNFFKINNSEYEAMPEKDYIYNTAIPISVDLKNKSIYTNSSNPQVFSFIDNTDKRKSLHSNNNVAITNLIKLASAKINANKQKIVSNGFRVYSSNESIYPLPIIRSLSIDSKLFNKINSLRLYGSGKLQDYLYKPKLKNLLKNQSNFYDFNSDLFNDDFDLSEDKFLYQFEDWDDLYEKNDENSNDIQNIYSLNNINTNSLGMFNNLTKNNNNFIQDFEQDFEDLENSRVFNVVKSEKLINKYIESDNDIEIDMFDLSELEELEGDIDYTYNENSYKEKFHNNLIINYLNNNNDTSFIENLNNSKISDIKNKYIKLNESWEDNDNYVSEQMDIDISNNDRFVDNSGINDINKNKWLFSVYKDAININSTFKNQQFTINKNIFNDFDFYENNELNDEILKDKNNNILSDFKNMIIKSSSDWNISNLPLNLNFSDSRYDLFEKNQNYYNNYSLEELQSEIVSNIKESEYFDDPFLNYNSELENLQNFLSSRFDNLEVSADSVNKRLGSDNKKYGINSKYLNFENLKFRQNNIDRFNFLRLSQDVDKKYKENNHSFILSKEKLEDFSISEVLNRSDNFSSNNWYLGRNVFDDIINDFDGSYDSEFSTFNNDNSSIIKKIRLLDNFYINEMSDNFAKFFIKNNKVLSNNNDINFIENSKIIKTKNISNINDSWSSIIKKNNNYNKLWNIFYKIDSTGNWKNKKNLKKIEQVSVAEKEISQNIVLDMNFYKGLYTISKDSLNLYEKNKENNKNIIRKLLRKSNSKNNGQFGRRKYKKLKKKYWNRLNILENYTDSLKKIINEKNYKLKNNKNAKICINGKPIQELINIYLKKEKYFDFYKNYNLGYDRESSSYIKNNFNSNSVSLLNMDNFIIDKSNGKGYNRPNLFEFFSKNLLNKKVYSNRFGMFNKEFGNFYNINNIEQNNYYNDNHDYLNMKTYLDFKNLELLENSILDKKNIIKNFDALNDSTDDDEDIEETLSIYSKIRNDIPKLQISKYGNSFLPLSVISTFLGKIPNLNFYEYLNESLKPANYYLNKKINKSNNQSNEQLKVKKIKKNLISIYKLNAIKFYKKEPVIDQFGIYHKNIKRPGINLKNRYSKLPIAPFRQFKNFNTILRKSLDYGLGDYIYKNSPVTRRSYDLAIRKFGPDFRTNSTMKGYGQIDDLTDFNLNSEEDSGLYNNLGYPTVNEQNLYVYDFPDILPYFGGNIYSDKFLGFLWDDDFDFDLEDADNNLDVNEPQESLYSNVPIFGYMSDSGAPLTHAAEPNEAQISGLSVITDILFLINNKDDSNILYNFEPGFSKYVQIWNNTIPLKYRDRDDYEDFYEDPMYNDLFSQDLNEEEVDNPIENSYAFSMHKDYPHDIVSNLEFSTGKIWETFSSKNITGPTFEKEVTVSLSKDYDEKNIGPLGYEEGDSLYDNRLLNRGWFPEKLTWNWGIRSQSRVGSDSSTLELLSDYSSSYMHDIDNFGFDADLEGLKSLSWAGSKNKVFNTIDDIIDGFGIEENIPFKPNLARGLWEWEEYIERPTYEDFDLENHKFNEDDEEEFYWNWKEPAEYHQFKDDNFNTLGLTSFISETNSWKDSNYFSGSDSAFLPGISIPLSNNNLYDGIVSDFTNFIYEKFPNNPNSLKKTELPLLTNNLFSNGDYIDSSIPEFSNYITVNSINNRWYNSNKLEEQKKESDSHFHAQETFKPKDSFNFSPYGNTFQKFEAEWIINGEGWLGDTGSNLPTISNKNLPNSYINPIFGILSQPRGLHSFFIQDDLDFLGGEDSPYFSLSDYQNNRIVRGRDNDTPAYPINSGWNLSSLIIPSPMNTFWSHRLKSRSFIQFDENTQDDLFNSENWNNFDESVGILSGEGYNFSQTLEENSDYIMFNTVSLNQRDLWWKSISGGFLNNKSKQELSIATLLNNNENYRDFLNSFDYRLFGKSWMNVQDIKMPLKSFNFYGDSQINNFLVTQFDYIQFDLEDKKTNADRLFLDYTFGFFKNSQVNFDLNLNFYSIKLRSFLYKIYSIISYYYTSIYLLVYDKVTISQYVMINTLIFKLDMIYFLTYYDIIIYSKSTSIPILVLKYTLEIFIKIIKLTICTLNFIYNNIQLYSAYINQNDNSNYTINKFNLIYETILEVYNIVNFNILKLIIIKLIKYLLINICIILVIVII